MSPALGGGARERLREAECLGHSPRSLSHVSALCAGSAGLSRIDLFFFPCSPVDCAPRCVSVRPDVLVLYPSAQLSRSYGPDAAAAKWRRAPAFSSNCRTGVSGTTRSPVSALRPHGAPPPRLRSSGAPRRSISNADVTSRGAAQPHSHSRHRSDSAESNSRRPHAGHVWDVPAAGTSMTAPPTLAKPQIVAHGQAVDDARHNPEVVPAQKHP